MDFLSDPNDIRSELRLKAEKANTYRRDLSSMTQAELRKIHEEFQPIWPVEPAADPVQERILEELVGFRLSVASRLGYSAEGVQLAEKQAQLILQTKGKCEAWAASMIRAANAKILDINTLGAEIDATSALDYLEVADDYPRRSSQIVSALQLRANARRCLGKIDLALQDIFKAEQLLTLDESKEDLGLLLSAHSIYDLAGRKADGMACLIKGLEILEGRRALIPEKRRLVNAYAFHLKYSEASLDSGDLDEAKRQAQMALDCADQLAEHEGNGVPTIEKVAKAHVQLGLVANSQLNFQTYYEQLVIANDLLNQRIVVDQSTAFDEHYRALLQVDLTTAALKAGKRKEADLHLETSLKLAAKFGKDPSAIQKRAHILKLQGCRLVTLGRNSRAERLLIDALACLRPLRRHVSPHGVSLLDEAECLKMLYILKASPYLTRRIEREARELYSEWETYTGRSAAENVAQIDEAKQRVNRNSTVFFGLAVAAGLLWIALVIGFFFFQKDWWLIPAMYHVSFCLTCCPPHFRLWRILNIVPEIGPN